MTAPDRTTWTNSLASALPAGISYDAGPGERLWRARRIAEFQAEHLAESGYVLIHPESVDEATIERLTEVIWIADDLITDEIGARNVALNVLAALAGTSAQARHTAGETGGGEDG